MPGHGPGDGRLTAGRLEGELRGAGAGEGFDEVEPDADQLGRAAFGERHAPYADLVVAGPGEDRALSCRSALEGGFGRGVELGPGRPRLPVVEIVHLREH